MTNKLVGILCVCLFAISSMQAQHLQNLLRLEVGGSVNGAGWDFSSDETSSTPKLGYAVTASYKWCILPKNKSIYIAPSVGLRTLGFNSVLSGQRISLDAKYLQSGCYIGFDAYKTGNILLAVEGYAGYAHALSGQYVEAGKSLEAFAGRFRGGTISLGGSMVAYYGRYLYARFDIQNMFTNISNMPNFKTTPVSYTLSVGVAI